MSHARLLNFLSSRLDSFSCVKLLERNNCSLIYSPLTISYFLNIPLMDDCPAITSPPPVIPSHQLEVIWFFFPVYYGILILISGRGFARLHTDCCSRDPEGRTSTTPRPQSYSGISYIRGVVVAEWLALVALCGGRIDDVTDSSTLLIKVITVLLFLFMLTKVHLLSFN